VFDAIDAHPWAGTQLSREPWQFAILPILEGVGRQLQALGVPEPAQFDCASAPVNYVLGLPGQYAIPIGEPLRQRPAVTCYVVQMGI